MSSETDWYPFEQGTTIGQQGSESGVIVRDEELHASTRITLEKSATVAPFAITCGVYGWFFHTRFFAGQMEAELEYTVMKTALGAIVAGLSAEDLDEKAARHRTLNSIAAFVEMFPT